MAVQMLFQAELGDSSAAECACTFDLEPYLTAGGASAQPEQRRQRVMNAFQHGRELLEGTLSHRDRIDELIRGQADNWRLERMPAVDRNILRLAVYEMLFDDDTPELVAVDEAIDLAKRFGSEQSGRFVNGLLDGLLKEHGSQRAVAPPEPTEAAGSGAITDGKETH
jgi:N utilization substance protein B